MKQDGSRWTSLAALMVFTVFAICLMLVLLTGAGVYRRLSEVSDARYTRQTAARYISTRAHQGRQCRIEDFEGTQALVFAEDFYGETYLTRVYSHDGWLMELFSAEDAGLSPEDGEKILPVEQVTFSQTGRMVTVRLEGEEFFLTLRQGRQVPHAK